MQRTSIEWCDFSTNPFKLEMPDGSHINVCVHKSRRCERCYAEALVRRFWKKEFGEFPGYTPALLKLGTPVLVEKELEAVLRLSDRIAKGKADPTVNRCFWHDMTDEYLNFWPDELLDRVWDVRALTPNLIHQILTKRPERMYEYLSLLAFSSQPPSNCHLGVSCENQQTADERIPWLLKTPAAVRWVSYEPAIARVDFRWYLQERYYQIDEPTIPPLSWIVCGGESGPGARPFNIQWARDVRDQCKAAGTKFFLKQMGARPFIRRDLWHNDQSIKAFDGDPSAPQGTVRLLLKDKKGGLISEWPTDLQIRDYPSMKTGDP